jgi:DNA-binding NarL/FixJ family response regulator
VQPIRILLAEDHQLVRAGLRSLLERIHDFVIVGEASNGREALRQTRQHNPDVVLMDVMMPVLNGLDATVQLTSLFPNVHVLILSMNPGENTVLTALRAGASGYLVKNITPTEMELAIRAVARGEIYLSSGVSRHVVSRCLERISNEKTSIERLTLRQREVLQLIAEGNSSKQIAEKLGIHVRTAETHRTQIMEALDIHDVAGLVRYAIRMGLISPEL